MPFRFRSPALAALALCIALPLPALAETAAPLPPGVEQMIRQAADRGDPALLEQVSGLALEAYPGHEASIRALHQSLRQDHEKAQRAVKRANGARILAGWTGSSELGASLSTGNSDDKALAFGLTLSKETLSWRHRVNASADYQRSDGETSKERFTAAYAPNYFVNDRFFVTGEAGWERDLFAGYRHRFTETVGLGYVLIDDGTDRLEVEGGPGARHTFYIADGDQPAYTENEFVFRGAALYEHQFNDDAAFSQNVRTLIGANNRTLEAVTALSTKLTSLFSAKISFTYRNESDPPDDREGTDTVTRATLVYSF